MQDTIDLTELCKNNDDFVKRLNKLKKDVKKIKSYEGHLFDSADKLLEYLEFDNKMSIELERIYVYAHVNGDLDLTDEVYQDYNGRLSELMNQMGEISSFVLPEILSHSYEEFLSFCKQNPKLNKYKRMIKDLYRAKKYTKNKEEEALISILTSSYDKPEDISELLINTDIDYGNIKDENNKDVHLTNFNFSSYIESSNPRVRKDAFDALYNQIKGHENTFASILATEVLNNNKIAKIRGFKEARDLSLYRNNVSNKIYDSLVENVSKNLPRFVKYFKLKKDILGLKDFHIYDTYASITKEYDRKYSYEEAKDIILKALSVLGEDYIKTLTKAFDNNWIDAKIRSKKRSGAYCTCAYATHPYVVASFEGKLEDVSTLAHELGHAMHYYYAQTSNSYQDYGYSIFVAEVASQVNEIILTDYLYKNSDNKEEKKYILDTILKRFKATIIRQTMFAEFEDQIHKLDNKGVTLTKNVLTNTYYQLNQKYFGSDVIIDDAIKYECFRIPHFYYNFYVYQYATGYAAAMKIAMDIIAGKKGAFENYLKFLKLGCTKSPCDSLKVAGVDMTKSEIYDDIFKVLEQKISELRKLYE